MCDLFLKYTRTKASFLHAGPKDQHYARTEKVYKFAHCIPVCVHVYAVPEGVKVENIHVTRASNNQLHVTFRTADDGIFFCSFAAKLTSIISKLEWSDLKNSSIILFPKVS